MIECCAACMPDALADHKVVLYKQDFLRRYIHEYPHRRVLFLQQIYHAGNNMFLKASEGFGACRDNLSHTSLETCLFSVATHKISLKMSLYTKDPSGNEYTTLDYATRFNL